DFLNLIWLIPLFPLAGAAMMLLFGKKLDPQPKSDVAIAPGVEPIYEHGHDHGHGHHHHHGHSHSHTHDHDHEHHHHDHEHGHEHHHDHGQHHDHAHGHHHHGSPLKTLIKLICPGMILISFILAAGAVWQLAHLGPEERTHQIVQFTWIAGMPFHMAN